MLKMYHWICFLLCSKWLLVPSVKSFWSFRFWVFSVYSENSSYFGISMRFSCLLASYGYRIVHSRLYGRPDRIFSLLNHHKSQQCVSLQTLVLTPDSSVYTEQQHTMLTIPTLKTYHPKPSYTEILQDILESSFMDSLTHYKLRVQLLISGTTSIVLATLLHLMKYFPWKWDHIYLLKPAVFLEIVIPVL